MGSCHELFKLLAYPKEFSFDEMDSHSSLNPANLQAIGN